MNQMAAEAPRKKGLVSPKEFASIRNKARMIAKKKGAVLHDDPCTQYSTLVTSISVAEQRGAFATVLDRVQGNLVRRLRNRDVGMPRSLSIAVIGSAGFYPFVPRITSQLPTTIRAMPPAASRLHW